MKNKTLIEIIAALFILLFVYTAVSKFFAFRSFNYVLGTSPLIGKNLAPIVAYAIPLLEIVISLLLFFPRTRKMGLWLSLGLMLLFTAYIGYLSLFVSHLPCRCGGVISKMSWTQHFYFNIFFTLLAVLGLWLYRKQRVQRERNKVQEVIFT